MTRPALLCIIEAKGGRTYGESGPADPAPGGLRPAGGAVGGADDDEPAALRGLLLSPDRETALVFLAFGYYPALREKLQAIPSAALRLLGKLVLCNAGIGAVWAASVWIFLLPAEELAGSAVLGALLVVLGNLTFLLYDLALARLTALYRKRWRRLLLRWLGAEP